MDLEVYKDNKQGLVAKVMQDTKKAVKTYHDVYKQSLSINQLAKVSHEVVVQTIFVYVNQFFPKFTKLDFELLYDDIFTTCKNWNALDFKLCYMNGLKGRYGKVYGDLKVSDVIEWMNRYQLDERFDIRQQIKHNKRFEELDNPNAIDNPLSAEDRAEFDKKHKKIGLDKSVDPMMAKIEIKKHGGKQENGYKEHMNNLKEQLKEK